MEIYRYFIIESFENERVDFDQVPGYTTFLSSRKSEDGSLFLLKLNEDQSFNFLDVIEKKWGPFGREDLDYILLEPTWRRNIYIK